MGGDVSGDMSGRVCLVTGATSGHGRAVAIALAQRGAELVLLGRNQEKCAEVQREIASLCGGKEPEILLCDLSSRREIDETARQFLASGRPLHVLVNNAGLVCLRRQETSEGVELTLAVNYLAMFQLTLRLLERLQQSARARVVNICSDTYRIASLDLDDLQLRDSYSVSRAYSQSKLAILYFTLELARRVAGSGVAVNAVDPGPVASNIGANNPGLLYTLAAPMIRYLFPSAARAARTALWVASAPELATESGGYYRSMKRRKRPLRKPDAALSRALIQESARLTGVDFPSQNP